MAELVFNIFISVYLGFVSIISMLLGLWLLFNPDNRSDRLFSVFALLSSIFTGLLIASLWTA